jgi:tetratricopeptide (TPR) repeat protein
MNDSSSDIKTAQRSSIRHRRVRLRFILLLSLATVVLSVSMWGITWWEDQPLRSARSLLEANAPEEALKEVDEFLKSHRDHSAGAALKARALSRLGRAAEAVRIFDQVGAASQDEMEDCVRAYLTLGQWVQAREVLEYLVTIAPDDADRYHELAACRAKLGEYDRAIDAAKIFASKPGKEARGYLLIGLLETDRGNSDKAVRAWERVLEVNPEAADLQVAAEEFFAELGSALLAIGDPKKAAVMLSKSVSIRETAPALAKLGSSLTRLAKTDEAIVVWEKTLTLDSKNEIAILGLTECDMRKSDIESALARLKPLEESSKPSSATAFLLSRVYSMAGNTEQSEIWKSRLEVVRKQEELEKTVNQILIENPSSAWGQILQSYRLAENGNSAQARILLAPHIKGGLHPFVAQLADALENESPLPPLDGLPLELFH